LWAWKSAPRGICWAAEKGKVGERYLLGAENLTLKGLLDLLAKITGLRAPGMKIPHGVALGVAYLDTAFSRAGGERAADTGWKV